MQVYFGCAQPFFTKDVKSPTFDAGRFSGIPKLYSAKFACDCPERLLYPG